MPRDQSFTVCFNESFELTVEDVWPDGGAPENPTAQDVADTMRKYGHKTRVMVDWNMVPPIEIIDAQGRVSVIR